MALLDGRWRLLYSSGFSSGSLGGRRPGPSFGAGPFTLGQVYQDILTGGWGGGGKGKNKDRAQPTGSKLAPLASAGRLAMRQGPVLIKLQPSCQPVCDGFRAAVAPMRAERSELNNVVDLFLRYSLAALPGG